MQNFWLIFIISGLAWSEPDTLFVPANQELYLGKVQSLEKELEQIQQDLNSQKEKLKLIRSTIADSSKSSKPGKSKSKKERL